MRIREYIIYRKVLIWTYFVHVLFIINRISVNLKTFLYIFPIDFSLEKRYILLVSSFMFLHELYVHFTRKKSGSQGCRLYMLTLDWEDSL